MGLLIHNEIIPSLASDGVNNTYGTHDVAANGDTLIAVRYSGSKMTIYLDGLLALEKKR